MLCSKNTRLLVRAFIGASLTILPAGAIAAVTVSAAATQNMICASGVCTPTGRDAVLNVNDLETLLATGNAEVTTTGSGVEAEDITIRIALSWSNSSALTLDAHRSLAIDAPVSIAGVAALTLAYGKKGTLDFGEKGSVTFSNLSSVLTINRTGYTLVNTIRLLANAVASNPAGAFALTADYDASLDGTYQSVPVPSIFTGNFEGLGHTILNLTVDDQNDFQVGLFYQLDEGATLRDVRLTDAKFTAEAGAVDGLGALAGVSCGTIANVELVRGLLYGAEGQVGGSLVGGLVGDLGFECTGGEIIRSSASGSVTNAGPEGEAGGLVGEIEAGSIELAQSSASVSSPFLAGGLVGEIGGGTVDQSFATGEVSVSGYTAAGGFVSSNFGTITNCYSTGPVSNGGNGGYFGGLAGVNNQQGINDGAIISDSYSTGRVKPGTGAVRGGFLGVDSYPGDMSNDYWDLDSSGITKTSAGAGSPMNDSGITGLRSRQLQSGLPAGFDPSIWGENPKINRGRPYLLANPPK